MSLQKQVSLHGRRAFVTKEDILCGKGGLATGGDGTPSIVFPSASVSAVFEDFLGDLSGLGVNDTGKVAPSAGVTVINMQDTGTAGQYFYVKQNDTGTTTGLTGGTNGIFRIVTTLTAATKTVAGTVTSVIGKQLAWKANQGPGGQSGQLRFGARVKANVYTGGTGSIFMGFTDVVSAEMPMYDTGGTADLATATEAIGFQFGADTGNVTGSDTGHLGWRGMSVKADVTQEVALTSTTPTANTWQTFEVEIHRGVSDTGGTATFYIDGTPLGRIVSPITTNTALTPVIAVCDTGGAVTLDIDWINVSAPRDTGT